MFHRVLTQQGTGVPKVMLAVRTIPAQGQGDQRRTPGGAGGGALTLGTRMECFHAGACMTSNTVAVFFFPPTVGAPATAGASPAGGATPAEVQTTINNIVCQVEQRESRVDGANPSKLGA